MGLTSSLFHDPADAEAQTLHRRIIPSEAQFDDQRVRWNALADHLCTALQAFSGYPISTWLQGSYKFGTQVRGARKGDEFDIDLGIYYRWTGRAEDGEHEPRILKRMVQNALQAYDDDSAIEVVSPSKARCCRIRFEGNFHIDVPAYHLEPDRDERQLATEANRWEESDPKALYLWLRDKFDEDTRTKLRRQIRYLKIWALLKFPEETSRPTSTLLTVLAAQAFDGIDASLPDDELLAALLVLLVERVTATAFIPNPVSGSENLAGKLSATDFSAFVAKLREFLETANEALAAPDQLSAADKWSGAFEHYRAKIPHLPRASHCQQQASFQR